jgi:hypothetical protein
LQRYDSENAAKSGKDTYTCTDIYARTRTHIRTHIHTRTHTHTHTYTYTHIHTLTHTHTHTLTHAHTHTGGDNVRTAHRRPAATPYILVPLYTLSLPPTLCTAYPPFASLSCRLITRRAHVNTLTHIHINTHTKKRTYSRTHRYTHTYAYRVVDNTMVEGRRILRLDEGAQEAMGGEEVIMQQMQAARIKVRSNTLSHLV